MPRIQARRQPRTKRGLTSGRQTVRRARRGIIGRGLAGRCGQARSRAAPGPFVTIGARAPRLLGLHFLVAFPAATRLLATPMKYSALFLALTFAISANAVVLPPSDDATVKTAAKTPVGAKAITIQVGDKTRGWIKFDLGQLPAGTTGAQVSRAIFRIFPSVLSKDTAFSVSLAQGAWTEATLTDFNAPAVSTPEIVNIPLVKGAKGSFVNLDVTDIVRDWLDNVGTNHGFVLSAALKAPIVGFDSKENAAAGHYPQLDITLSTIPGPQGPTGAQGPAGTTGASGTTGAVGVKGDKGDNGNLGGSGPIGATGSAGSAGSQGPQGPAGISGSDFVYGDGSAGAFTAPAGVSTLDVSNPQFTTFTVGAGNTLHIPSGKTVRCNGAFTNNGTIIVDAVGGAASYDVSPGLSSQVTALAGISKTAPAAVENGSFFQKGKAFASAQLRSLINPGAVGGGTAFPATKSDDASNVYLDFVFSAGGGAVRLFAKGNLTNNGSILARGENGQPGNYVLSPSFRQDPGSGGGGGILILASAIAINQNGSLSAIGGNGSAAFVGDAVFYPGAGGGGGLIRLLAPSVTGAGLNVVTAGANGSTTGFDFAQASNNGSAGGASAGDGGAFFSAYIAGGNTLVVHLPTNGLVIIDQCNPAALLLQ